MLEMLDIPLVVKFIFPPDKQGIFIFLCFLRKAEGS